MPEENATEELERVPGLFRRWELAELLRIGEDYHLEDVGTTAEGTPLVAVYRRARGGVQ